MNAPDSQRSTVRWGILGCGSIAHNFVQALPLVPTADLVAVASRSNAAGFSGQYRDTYPDLTVYQDYAELAGDPAVDAVYIATTHNFHFAHAMLCLEQGKHVLCEKPITINADQLVRLRDTARRHDCFLMEALWTRFLPGIRQLTELLQQRVIGDVRLLQANFGIQVADDPQHRLLNPQLAGGALLDLGIYPLNFARIVYGRELISARSVAEIGPTGVDEVSAYLLQFAGGGTAVLSSSCRVATPHTALLYGTTGSIEVEDFFHPSVIHVRTGSHTHTYQVGYPATGFQYEIQEASHCILSGLAESRIMPIEESLQIISLMDQFRADWGLSYPD
ncbi:putative dehydrogenase [Spirochaeta africana DSM 8902]|uniref:Putative dehydrogenase n=2 Tax=Spirochaeta TaxID=146 RepID=H9UFU9_SPIAZ|nr:putative dehydrogenase [Spirochaeta africana DSM 8902]